MSEKVIDAMGSIRFGWNTLKANLKFFVVLMAIVGIADLFVQLVSVGLPSEENNMGLSSILTIFVFLIVSVTIRVIFEVGLIKISIMFRNCEKPQIRDLYRSNPIILMNYLVASCIYLLMVLVGLLLLVVPGIYLILKYQFYDYLIVDRGMGPFEALKESGRMTGGAKTSLFYKTLRARLTASTASPAPAQATEVV